MKAIFIVLAAFFIGFTSFSQECLRYRKYEIGSSGRFAYFSMEPSTPEVSQMDNGSTVYTTEVTCGVYTYGLVLITFKTELSDSLKREEDLVSYIGVVKEMGGITNCVGYGKGHSHPETVDAAGIIDYCEDSAGNSWDFKGWINPSCAAVLYVTFPPDTDNSPTESLFLDSFRFSE